MRQAKIWLASLFVLAACSFSCFLSMPFHLQDLLNMKAQYLTPGLWQMEGIEFWSALIFETPFALIRSGALNLLILALALFTLVLLLYCIARAYTLSRKVN